MNEAINVTIPMTIILGSVKNLFNSILMIGAIKELI
jgi:hypothetical protein